MCGYALWQRFVITFLPKMTFVEVSENYGNDVDFRDHEIREAIINNVPCESKLHVVAVCSNPCQFKRRYALAKEFSKRMEAQQTDVIFYMVELAYGDQKFCVTSSKNKRHLQLRAVDVPPLWHKENLINIAVEKLLPSSWKAFAWIDADIEFDNPHWATDALKVLNGSKDIVQLFSHAVDMDKNQNCMNVFPSFGFQYCNKRSYNKTSGPNNFWHPGYAWACTRRAYTRLGGLYEVSILGSGDHIMSLALIGRSHASLNSSVSDGYKATAQEFQKKGSNLRLGYVPGVIRHYFHGSKKNRKYADRWQILIKHKFDPLVHVARRSEDGLIVPTAACPEGLLKEIMNYFAERNEDEN